MIHVLATVHLQPGAYAAFAEAFAALIPQVQAEDGCLEYTGPARDVVTQLPPQQLLGSDSVLIVEKWTTLEALQAHLQAGHMVAFRSQVQRLVVGTSLQIVAVEGKPPAALHDATESI